MKHIAIFASGGGSNAQKIIDHFAESDEIKIVTLLSNKADAFALERAEKHNIPTRVFDRPTFRETDEIVDYLKSLKVDLIVLAGFLWLVPKNLVNAFPNKIINIHPALLPKYGGKGMHGMHVHTAVAEAKEKESGITIHYVNERYDEGNVIFQAKCKLTQNDHPNEIAAKVLKLEHEHFPKVIEQLLRNN